jgi:Holliday junction resolvasome RuvABC endonuclease subunit
MTEAAQTPARGATVLGLDPGFSRFGWALVLLLPEGGERVLDLGVFCTEKGKAKGLVREDDRRRAAELGRALLGVTRRHAPAVVCAEALSHVNPREAHMPVSTTTKVGRAWGLIDLLCELHEVALVQASPQAIKKATCGVASASKVDVQGALVARYPELVPLLQRIPASKREHAVDALGSIVASLHANELRLARRYAAQAS